MQRYQPPHARRQQAQSAYAITGPPQVQDQTQNRLGPNSANAGGPSRHTNSNGASFPLPDVHGQLKWGRSGAGNSQPGREGPRAGYRQGEPSMYPASAVSLGSAPASASDRFTPRPSRKDWSSSPASNDAASFPRNDARGSGSLSIRGSASSSNVRSSPSSTRSHTQTPSSVLASPASDIKPMRSRTPGLGTGAGAVRTPDEEKARSRAREMEMMQSVSRSGGDGAEGDALKDWTTQERYREYIDERIEAHYKSFNTPRHTPPGNGSTEEVESLSSIVLLFRKLREGVVASGRIDRFAIEVFESSVQFSILARNRPQLISSLSGLVPGLYQAFDQHHRHRHPSSLQSSSNRANHRKEGSTTRTTESSILEAKLSDLTLAEDGAFSATKEDTEKRAMFASLLLLYQLVVLGQKDFWATYFTLTLAGPTKPQGPKATSRSSSMPRTLDGLDEDEDQQPQGADASSPHLHTVSTGDTAQPQFQLMHADAERINEEQTATETRPFLLYPASSSPGISFALTAARCTSQTSFNPLRYFSLLSETYQPQPQSRSHTPALCETPAQNHSYERAILSWMEDDIRERAWRLLERSYISCGTGWAGNILGLGLGSRVNGGNEDRVEKYVSGKGKKVDLDRGLVLFR